MSLHSDGQLHSIVLGGTPAVLNEWAIASWLHVEPVAKPKKVHVSSAVHIATDLPKI